MSAVERVRGVVQHYDWGDPAFIPGLLGVEPDGRPWAELWLGTHPNGPTTFDDGSPLSERTGPLPYLFKVLAAARPLSLQTHPDRARAAAGHAAGRYPDAEPKPELLCALTPFEALCGIRPVEATMELLDELGVPAMAAILSSDGPFGVLDGLYRGRIDPRPVVEACGVSARPEATWVRRLAVDFPGQPSVAATLLLNHVRLEPGEAIRLAAGNLHAYLAGAGLELMGASDNVVRGGLTSKPVDVEELLAVVDPRPLPDPVLPAAHRHRLDEAAVALELVDPGVAHTSTGHELAVDLGGGTWYVAPGETVQVEVPTWIVVPTSIPDPPTETS